MSNSKLNQSLFVTNPSHQFIRGKYHSGYIPFNEAVNQLSLISANTQMKAKIKVDAANQVDKILQLEQNNLFQNMMENMMNKLQRRSDEGHAMKMRMDILRKLPVDEQS
ncbi:MAG: hypothetical protein EZS28_038721 [Streblomastix strix]|uniref:Uncharacterized protein n=1 Tax=Streblomastix strix TaxID=222440 RepID=A0A5J4U719_9EUKA|nr:MAG: hypothetical protein EZS28_038721 [Streblomastix strix]